ncbi:hypothetical protein K7X08_006235 [Anisodus acutangulus]|uniref:Uncharacterized protein n=1 Tax=Anisodus acutangulus TaxID=402998 RepID=A0A9Q1MW40_9SOLA|nr:hypothetical protein K7X08_006235 [Anisodus acutangulus]
MRRVLFLLELLVRGNRAEGNNQMQQQLVEGTGSSEIQPTMGLDETNARVNQESKDKQTLSCVETTGPSHKSVDDINPTFYGPQEKGNNEVGVTKPTNDIMAGDILPSSNDATDGKMQQGIASNEPFFDDIIAGREAREYYMLSKMGFGDIIDEEEIEKYNQKVVAEKLKSVQMDDGENEQLTTSKVEN